MPSLQVIVPTTVASLVDDTVDAVVGAGVSGDSVGLGVVRVAVGPGVSGDSVGLGV